MKSKKIVLLLTDFFPYGRSEEFLTSEVDLWAKIPSARVILVPLLDLVGPKRNIPVNILVDNDLKSILKKAVNRVLFYLPIVLINPFFWKEVSRYPRVLFSKNKLRKLIAVSIFSKLISNFLKKKYHLDLLNNEVIIYSYWFYYGAYGASLLKRYNYKFRLVTRAHGADVFQNRADTNYYIPFRRFDLVKYIDNIFAVSNETIKYLHSDQGISLNKLSLSYLGVKSQSFISNYNEGANIHIVSVSSIIPVKRLELIIDSLATFKANNNSFHISWTHIGDGANKEEILSEATTTLTPMGIDVNFTGFLNNDEIFSFYRNNCIECFLNTSSSEGLPVSILEAGMVGIPVIATDVGGVREAVNESNGYLMRKDFSFDEFDRAIRHILTFKDHNKRMQISRSYTNKFNSEANFNDFIRSVLQNN